jgi:hypothetical protein
MQNTNITIATIASDAGLKCTARLTLNQQARGIKRITHTIWNSSIPYYDLSENSLSWQDGNKIITSLLNLFLIFSPNHDIGGFKLSQ